MFFVCVITWVFIVTGAAVGWGGINEGWDSVHCHYTILETNATFYRCVFCAQITLMHATCLGYQIYE